MATTGRHATVLDRNCVF